MKISVREKEERVGDIVLSAAQCVPSEVFVNIYRYSAISPGNLRAPGAESGKWLRKQMAHFNLVSPSYSQARIPLVIFVLRQTCL